MISRPAATAVLLLAMLSAGPAGALDFISVGTGPVGGLYYPTGRALCSLVNRQAEVEGLRCSVEATSGSVYNLDALAQGEEDFAIVQSDVQYDAFNGRGRWAGRPLSRLRAVMSIYPEPVTIVASAESGIAGLDDLKGKRLNIGNPGSGTRATWETLEAALGWNRETLRQAAELRQANVGTSLCEGRIDAFLALTGNPSPLLARTLADCPSHLVDVTGPAIDRLVAERPYYARVTIPAASYGLPRPVETFGGSATLVTSADLPEHIVHAVTAAALQGIGQLVEAVPPMAGTGPAQLAGGTLTAPLHPGAERAFREHGLRN